MLREKMLRIIALALAMMLLLAACGGNTPAAPGAESDVSQGMETPPVSAPGEEPSDVPPAEEPSAP